MLCNWSKAANNILHGVLRRGSGSLSLPTRHESRAISLSPKRSFLTFTSFSQQPQGKPAAAFAAPAALTENAPLPDSSSFSNDLSSVNLTSAQMSRASAQAVRLCARGGRFGDALYLVNSLHYSVHRNEGLFRRQSPKARSGTSQLVPIDFGRPVSPLLSAHSFLHGLIRAGHGKKAARYAELMIHQGFRIRLGTMNAIIHSLTPRVGDALSGGLWNRAVRLNYPRDGPQVLELRSTLVADPHTRTAVRLLQCARSWSQARSREMYHHTISGCLMQGEIIVASLLFGLLVKDWQLRHTLHGSTVEEETTSTDEYVSLYATKMPPRPSSRMMHDILREIENTFARDPDTSDKDTELRHSLQALANIAMLLDTGQLEYGRIAQLIHTMYSCPKTNRKVWIKRNGRAEQVEAYSYFQGVLLRLVKSLKPAGANRPCSLDRRSYHTLLNYTLRHRLSPELATRVLEHMCIHRDPPLQPDIVTYNILIRSGTLIRKSAIAQSALQSLRQHKVNFNHGIMVTPAPAPVEEQSAVKNASREAEQCSDLPLAGHQSTGSSQIELSAQMTLCKPDSAPKREIAASDPHLGAPGSSKMYQRLDLEQLSFPDPIHRPRSEILADASTLSSYIAHLTVTGKPFVVSNVLFHILPELRMVDHPSWGSLTPDERRDYHRETKEARLRRAILIGPYVFTAILNALEKSHKIGLAERVWLLAKQAEKASWTPNFAPDLKPWCLPIHAYTALMRCYASMARKGLALAHRKRKGASVDGDGDEWKPRSTRHKGWAAFVQARKHLKGTRQTRRHPAHRRLGMLLHRCMQSGGQVVYRALRAFVRSPPLMARFREGERPVPDARFFNAALDLFGRHPNMRPRRRHAGRAYWRRRLMTFHGWYERKATRSALWTPAMQELAEFMVAEGFTVPPGFRSLFNGRWVPGSQFLGERPRRLDRRPYAFPPVPSTFRPHGLPDAKIRGLPIPHRHRRRRGAQHLWGKAQCSFGNV
ncbi:hypothetical protein WOLCODRAFT_137466 [Wolfiporia cocos MD-104 SS10]|uniref:Uncharacterized protein n=1 Tax=Wolfiporia cocos (strain MD-104) TaxID=742152 RepID=A0A2H3JJ42_WOLCO|nr:hypothetical protein WOLCODRAFT_137466 [Wolfiporia cocos MD-104 SS10]